MALSHSACLGGVTLGGFNSLLKAQHAFMAHLDEAASRSVEVDNEVDDQGDEHHKSECREGDTMSGDSRCIAESRCCQDNRS